MKIELKIENEFYFLYVVYDIPPRRVYLCKCDLEQMDALEEFFIGLDGARLLTKCNNPFPSLEKRYATVSSDS